MNSRERWTVYPLLFLAVGMGIKTRMTGIDNVPAIGCQKLTINGDDGKPLVRIHATPANQGQIDFFSPEGKLLLTAGSARDGKAGQMVIVRNGKPQVEMLSDGQAGLVRTCGPDGKPQMVLRSSKRGGNALAWRNDHKLLMMLGHDDGDSGVFAIDAATGGRAAAPFATLPRMPVVNPSAPKREQKPSTPPAEANDGKPASAETDAKTTSEAPSS